MHCRLVLLLIILTLAVGCGPGGIPRYQVSGQATFDGKPIPSGRITFQPDRSQGNIGPSSTAMITDGKYSTPRDKGVTAGVQEVTIYGFDGSPPSEPLPFGKPIFPGYQTTLEVPDKNTVHDFEVPKER